MFSKTKRKIVFTVVFSLLALLAVTLTTIYLSNRFAINAENMRTLRTYAQQYSLAGQQPKPADNERPDERPDGRPGNREDKNEPRFQLSTFYSVAFSEEGEVLAVNNGNSVLRSEDELIRQASALMKGGKKSGRKGDLTYLVEDNIIKTRRKALGYTQSELAGFANMNIRTLRGYEQGTLDIGKAAGDTLYNLSRSLGCSIEDLLKR